MFENFRDSISGSGKTYLMAGGVVAALLLTGFVFTSFGNTNSGEVMDNARPASAGSNDLAVTQSASFDAAPEAEGGSGSAESDRKRITSIRMDFEVPDVIEAQGDTETLVSNYGGWTESENLHRDDGDRGSMTVRVPKNNLSAFMEDLEEEDGWKLESKSRDVEDVTERYTELELELKNKRQELRKLEKMMNESEEVESLIKIQERMSELRSRIQYLENEMNQIDKRVEYVRVSIDFEEPRPITSEFDIRDSVNDGYRGIFKSINLIIVGAGYLLPFGIIAGIVHLIRKTRSEEAEEG